MMFLTRSATSGVRNVALAISLLILGVVACDDKTAGSAVAAAPSGQYKFTITDDDLVVGDANAPITIVEYSSFTCPHCAHFHEEVFPALEEKYLKTGKARLVMRPFFWDGPAANAALLTFCAPEEKKMPLVGAIFANQPVWMRDEGGPIEGLVKIARQAMISREDFAACVADEDSQAWAGRHLEEAKNIYEINSTPTFFINGEKFPAMRDVAELDRIMAKFTGEATPE